MCINRYISRTYQRFGTPLSARRRRKASKKYEDVFLAAVFDDLAVTNGSFCAGMTSGATHEKSVTRAMRIWERVVDMRYVPKGNMEYRVESAWRV